MTTPSFAQVATELGFLHILHGQVKEARLWYQQAMKLEESSVTALTGPVGPQGRTVGVTFDQDTSTEVGNTRVPASGL